jgi:predicted chitinase
MSAPHKNGSFSYKTISPVIKGILDRRSQLENTIQIGMPFVKATTTVELPDYLGAGNIGFTLGMHAIDQDVKAEDIYSSQDGDALIGYTYTPDGKTKRVYAKSNSAAAEFGKYFDTSPLFQTTDSSFIPPPGITSVTIGRNKNGLLASADINFTVPTLTQLEVLHRTFLIPGCGMVLEWGQQFAEDGKEDYGERGLNSQTIEKIMFPWYRRGELYTMLGRLAEKKVGLEEILRCYVWPTQGQYMWMFGRVANFSTKANSDGSFDCTVKIVGSSEDAWAYTTRNTVVPPRDSSGKICPDNANSVESYFTKTSTGLNLKSLLEKVMSSDAGKYAKWKNHVLKFDKGNKKEGEPQPNATTNPNASEKSFADSEDAYFMSWRFFVNVVLNDDEMGVLAIFRRAQLIPRELKNISLLRPYTDSAEPYINDPYENYVGNNPYLRSVDPSTMIIVNELAARQAAANLQVNRPNIAEDLTKTTDLTEKFKSQGDFHLSVTNEASTGLLTDRGFLSTGVWLNHKAVVQSMASSDTILRGIISLLDRMNAATLGFWQLTVDTSDPLPPTVCGSDTEPAGMNYVVIDVNYKENSEYAVKEFIENVHVFNKYIRTDKQGNPVGSELLECNVDLNLPKRLFSQIATLGLVQPQDMQQVQGAPAAAESPILGDNANETLRKMFAITMAASDNPAKQGPDLTIPPKIDREELLRNATCGKMSGQTTAGTAGQGNALAGVNIADANTKSNDDLKKAQDEAREKLNSSECQTCKQNEARKTPTVTPPVISVPAQNGGVVNYCQTLTGDDRRFCEVATTQGITDPVELAQMLAQFKHESNLKPVAENLRYNGAWLFRIFPKTATRTWGFESLEDAETVCCGKDPQALANRIYGTRMGNSAPGDGYKYRGRGFVQLTGKDQYRSVGNSIGEDLVNNPDLMLNFEVASKASIDYWKRRVRPAVRRANTSFQDTTVVTKAINGGEIGLADRQRKFGIYVEKFGITQVPATTPATTPTAPIPVDTSVCGECKKAEAILQQTTTAIESNSRFDQGKDTLVREFPNLEDVFRYIEPYGEWMTAKIARTADGNISNAFGASPGTLSISAELVMPGVNGLRVGELFWIDKIPAFYRAFGAFQILSIEDTIGLDGWKTKISSKFNYLGTKWKEATAKILEGRA